MDETILVNYLQGECNDEEAARVEAWCEEGPENRKTLEQLYYTLFVGERIAVMNTVDTEASLDQFKSAIREKEKKAKRKSISIRWGRYATVAAAFLTGLVFAGGIAWGLLSNKLSDYEVITAAGQRAQTVLPDGSKVWLNASSKIVYHNSLWSSDRQIDLSGEAYFEVSKNKEKPFIVKTTKGDVEVLGTKFYISAYATTDVFETSLIEGKVKVHTAYEDMTLYPKDKAVLENGLLTRKQIDDMDTYRWRDGLYCFKNLSFDDVLKQFEIYYDIRFVKENPQIANPKLNGKFRLIDGVDYALRVLQREVGFSFRRDDEANVIYLK